MSGPGPFIRRKGIWRPQFVPSGPVEIDWTHPLAQGLAVLYIPGAQSGWSDLCKNAPPLVPGASVSLRAGTKGIGFYSPPSGSAAPVAATQKLPASLATINGFQFVSGDFQNGGGGFPYIWTAPGYTQIAAVTGPDAVYFQVSNGNYVQFPNLASASQSALYGAYNTSSAGEMYGYINGVLAKSGTGQTISFNGGSGYTEGTFQMGGGGASVGMTVFFAGAYFKPPPADLIAWQGVEPLAMLRRKVRRTYSIIGAPADPASGAAAFGGLSATGTGNSQNSASGTGAFGQLNAPGSVSQSDSAAGQGGFDAIAASGGTTATDAGQGNGAFAGVSASGQTQTAGQDNASGTAAFGSPRASATGTGGDPAQGAAGFGPAASSGNASTVNRAAGDAGFSGLSAAAQAAGITPAIVTGHATFGLLIASGAVTMRDAADALAGFGPVIVSAEAAPLIGFDVAPGRVGTFPADRRAGIFPADRRAGLV